MGDFLHHFAFLLTIAFSLEYWTKYDECVIGQFLHHFAFLLTIAFPLEYWTKYDECVILDKVAMLELLHRDTEVDRAEAAMQDTPL